MLSNDERMWEDEVYTPDRNDTYTQLNIIRLMACLERMEQMGETQWPLDVPLPPQEPQEGED